MSSYSNQSQQHNQTDNKSSNTNDSGVSAAQNEYGNAALQDILFASTTSATSDNTSEDLFSSNSYQALEHKHTETSKNIQITMS